MTQVSTTPKKPLTIKQYMSQDGVSKKFEELLGEESKGFITSVMQVVSNNNLLAKAQPESIYQSAAMAAVLNLPINNNLGLAYIVPFGNKAQLQIGWKGFYRLAIRSGDYKTIGASAVYEGQLIANNPLEGCKFDFSKPKPKTGKPIGYASYFELKNGFVKTLYMTAEELEEHGKKYSKSYNSAHSLWKKDFPSMALKTVYKMIINKFGPMSLEMQKAVVADQAEVKDHESEQFTYPDSNSKENQAETINEEFAEAEVVNDDDDDEVI
jgi:recombination protein RecT